MIRNVYNTLAGLHAPMDGGSAAPPTDGARITTMPTTIMPDIITAMRTTYTCIPLMGKQCSLTI